MSINSLREDLQKSHKTVSRWIDIFERLYGLFRLSSLGGANIKAVKKEQKHYHYDWALCPEGDSAGREVDFVITEKNKPTLLVEVKVSSKKISPSLKYLKGKYPQAKAFQVQSGKRF